MKYEILLPYEVEFKLAQGWELYGSPFATEDGFYQAVVKKVTPLEKKSKPKWASFDAWYLAWGNVPNTGTRGILKAAWEAARQ